MTREEAKDFLPIMQAFSEGKTIQRRFIKGFDYEKEWVDDNSPNLSSHNFEYRIKPETKYRPFKNAEECWQEMQKHQPFGWLQDKGCKDFKLFALSIDNDGVMIADYDDAIRLETFKEVYLDYTFTDSMPFGVRGD